MSIGGMPLVGTLGKFTWRMCALVLASQSVVVFFGALVAWGIASAAHEPSATAYLLVGSAVAVLCLIAAGLMRTAYGVTLGWLVQVGTLLAAFVVPLMALVGLIFGGLWVTCLVQGLRIDAEQAARAAAADDETTVPPDVTGGNAGVTPSG